MPFVCQGLLPHGLKYDLENVEPHISVYLANFSKACLSFNLVGQIRYLSCYLNSDSVAENVFKHSPCIFTLAVMANTKQMKIRH